MKDEFRIILAALVIGMGATLRFPLNVIQIVLGVLFLAVAIISYLKKK